MRKTLVTLLVFAIAGCGGGGSAHQSPSLLPASLPSAAPGGEGVGATNAGDPACAHAEPEVQPSRTITPAFRILKLDYGFVVQQARTRLYFVAGYSNEFRRGNGLPAENRLIRSDPYVAIGLHSF